MIRRVFIFSILASVVLAGCHSSKDASSQSDADVTVYHLRGKVVSTDQAHGIVVLDHEAIPGFMEAMTMPYQLKDPSIVSELHPGDVITADVLVSKSAQQTVVLDHIVVVAQAQAGLQARGDLSRAGAGRQGSRLQAAQPGRAADSSGAVQGQDAADHVYLHALPAAEFLPAGDAQLCGDQQGSWRPIRRCMRRRICCA